MTLDAGTFDVVRARLDEQGKALGGLAERLNARRLELFGGESTRLLGSARVRTEHNAVPRDIVNVGDRFLLGYQVFLGLKAQMAPGDVFTELRDDGQGVVNLDPEHPPRLLADPAFAKDFAEVFQYYKDARLLHFRRTDRLLLAAFQTGSRLTDLRVLRWALDGRGAAEGLRYLDNRGDRDYVFPAAQDFTWTRATRDMHVQGAHPHIAIDDEIFVECINGDLTIKVENNTTSGAGIFSDPVDDPTQGLDDAEIWFAVLPACILLKVRPYREHGWRHIVFNRATREAVRIDAIGLACQQLPEGHGLVFPGGYYLSTGVHKLFPIDAAGMEFKRAIRAPNGEDVAYVFYRRDQGTYQLLQYSLITREMASPVVCSSYCRLPDGRLVVLRAEPEPTRVHTLQIWQTPFLDEEVAAARAPTAAGELANLGNRELVRAVSDCLHLCRLIGAQRPTRQVYEELLKAIGRVVDTYPWLAGTEGFGIRATLDALRATAERVIDEFEKLVALTAQAESKLVAAEKQADALAKAAALADRARIEGFVAPLSAVRAARGHAETLKTVRYMDLARLARLDARLARQGEELAKGAVELLRKPEALAAWQAEIAAVEASAAGLTAVAEARPVLERLDAAAAGLDQLVGLVNALEFAEAAARTEVLERIGETYASVNRARAVLAGRRQELGAAEAAADFAVQDRLLAQALANAVALCDSPERCDEFTAKLLVQVEELEGRFADFDRYAGELAERRVAVTEQLASRRQALVDERSRKADGWLRAAERILQSAAGRAVAFTKADDLNAWFGSDPLIAKVRQTITDLRGIGDQVKADDLAGRLKAVREDGLRAVRDKSELFDGADAVRLGRHRFSVNTAPIDLVMLPRPTAAGVRMHFHLTGTDYLRVVDDPGFAATAPFWELPVEGETPAVYRGEYLAWQILRAAERGAEGLSAAGLREALLADGALAALVQEAAARRVDQGYERGVHDHDAAKILAALIHLTDACGLLRHPAAARALALVAWARHPDPAAAARLQRQARSLAAVRGRFGGEPLAPVVAACAVLIAPHAGGAPAHLAAQAAAYLAEELARPAPLRFVRSADAAELAARFADHQRLHPDAAALDADLHELAGDPAAAAQVAGAWIAAFASTEQPHLLHAVPEVVAGLLAPTVPREDLSARTAATVDGLLGIHPRIVDKRLELRIDDVSDRLTALEADHVPAWRAYARLRRELVDRERARLRLDEFRPRVLTTFVRNRLISEVFLPLIGDNLAKQIGALGENRRTDLQGLLLLISPPGYGKTTLMEYVCAVLGLAFVKVNGPALGHRVKSLDPAEAPNAQARQEVERINLSFAMGNNVMLYLDDIQHCDPELLQKFISLCDGQRKIEAVWDGGTKTFDLRGKKFVVVMAGNPYTESGEKFRIPDMLANRADTHNLGDAAGSHQDAFALSYLENCLAVNPVMQPLLARSLADVGRFQRIAAGDDGARGELEHPYAGAEVAEISAVVGLLGRVQRALLTVNQTYIASAGQADEFRSEPPFKLQGSYRNMAKIAGRIVPAMTPAEVDALILAHYRAESQTLTTGAEANLLKLRHLLGAATPEDQQRWADICRVYGRRQELAGADDPMSQAVVQLARLGERIDAFQQALARDAALARTQEGERLERLVAQAADSIRGALAGVANTPAPKVEVVNTLPKYYAQVFDHHLKVVETSLAPALDLLGRYVGATQQTRERMEAIATDLRALAAKQASMGYRETPPPT
jgi:hypothetical protein